MFICMYYHFQWILSFCRCRHGYFHVVNNDYTKWEMYAIGGSAEPTINSQGNRFLAPDNRFTKEVKDLHSPILNFVTFSSQFSCNIYYSWLKLIKYTLYFGSVYQYKVSKTNYWTSTYSINVRTRKETLYHGCLDLAKLTRTWLPRLNHIQTCSKLKLRNM